MFLPRKVNSDDGVELSRRGRRERLVGNARAAGLQWRRQLVLLVVVAAGAVALVLGWQYPLVAALAGMAIGIGVALLAARLLREDDPQLRRLLSSRRTGAALGAVRGWSVLNDLKLGEQTVDHVVLTSGAVLVVQSRTLPVTSVDATAELAFWLGDLRAARAAAKKVRRALRAELDDAVPVTPVLLVSGPGAPQLAHGFDDHDGVPVADGERIAR